MELSQKEKDRIMAEEKARLEARREFYKESYGGCCGHSGYGSGCCHRGHGWSIFKALLILFILLGVLRFWHQPYCGPGACLFGSPSTTTTTTAPAVPPAKK